MEKTQGDFKYALRSDGTAEITAYGGTAGVLAIPAELDGHAVTVIGDGAFAGGAEHAEERGRTTGTHTLGRRRDRHR